MQIPNVKIQISSVKFSKKQKNISIYMSMSH